MSKFTKEMVDDYAEKLLIGLTPNEIPGIENVEPMTHTLDDFEYELREDVVEESVPIDDLLSNCDDVSGREVEVPKVVG